MTCDSKINLFKNGQHWEQRQRPRKKRKPWMNPGARECRLANPERDYLNTKHTPCENLMVHPLQKRCLQKNNLSLLRYENECLSFCEYHFLNIKNRIAVPPKEQCIL